jgi:hypothetical protein
MTLGTHAVTDLRGNTLDLGNDDQAQSGQRNRSGIRIRTNEAVDGVTCRLSSETVGVVTAYLTTDGGRVLERQTIATLEPGGTFAFETELNANTAYWVLCDASGRSYTRGRAAVNYPIEGESLVATHGIFTGSGSRSNSYRYCIDQITLGVRRSEIGATLDLRRDAQVQANQSNRSGVRIQATDDVDGLTCRLSTATDGVTTAYLTNDSGTVLEQEPIDFLESGEVLTFDAQLEAGQTYWVLADASGQSYSRGRAQVEYPIESDSLVATHGIFTGSGSRSSSYRYCFDRIQPAGTNLEIGSTLALGTDDQGQSWSGLTGRSGVRIRTTEAVRGLECRLSTETEGVTTAYLTSDGGSVLERQTIATLDAGETFRFETRLEAGTTYRILCDARGREYVRGRSPVNYPLRSRSLVATHGIFSGNQQSDSFRYCIDRIRPTNVRSRINTLHLRSDETAQSWSGLTGQSGIRFQVTEDLFGLEGRLSTETEGVTTAYLTDDSGTVLDQQSIGDLEPGGAFVFGTELEAGTTYRLLCDADGQSYVRGRAPVDYPLETRSVEATHGIYSDNLQSDSYRYCIDRLRTIEAIGGVDTLSLEGDDVGQSSYSSRSGVRIQTTEAAGGLECRLSPATNATMAYVTDDNGNVLSSQSIANVESGETFAFDAQLEADEAYWIVCDGGGSIYTRGRASVNYPLESDRLVATHGIFGGNSQSGSFRYCVDRIRTTPPRRGLLASLRNQSIGVTTVNVVEHPAINENGDLSAQLLNYLQGQDVVNHEFILPARSYNWNTNFSITSPIEFLAIRGAPRATLRVRNHNVSVAFRFGTWGSNNPPQHVVVQNVDVDISDVPERDAALMNAHVGRCLIDNVELVGQRNLHTSVSGNRYTFLMCTRNENATSVIRNVSATDGEVEDPNAPMVGAHTIGFSADPPHEGINVWHQCLVEDFVSSGYYVRNSPGVNIMNRTAAVNNGNSGLRLGREDEARDCTIVYDDMADRAYAGTGLWFNEGQPIAERIEIDGTDSRNDIVRVNSEADGGHIRNLDLFCGPTATAPTMRYTQTSATNNQGILVEDFAIEDVTTASNSPSITVRRPDVTLRSGVVTVQNRPALGGTYSPTVEDVVFE